MDSPVCRLSKETLRMTALDGEGRLTKLLAQLRAGADATPALAQAPSPNFNSDRFESKPWPAPLSTAPPGDL